MIKKARQINLIMLHYTCISDYVQYNINCDKKASEASSINGD